MITHNLLRECGAYINLNLAPRDDDPSTYNRQAPAITVSRQTGARGIAICEKLHARLQERDAKDPLPWTLYDSELGKKILQDHGLPEYLEKFIPDQAVGEFEATINELLGRHPSLVTLFNDSKETIQHLAKTGHSIIVGRGGNRILHDMHNVLKVRLIGSHKVRHYYVINNLEVSPTMADEAIKRADHARRSYLKQHFSCDIDDPYLYDLVINTDQMTDDGIVDLIVDALESLKA
ncbi:MAG: AAA family ATPase [Coraliomargarita sp.]